LNDDLVDAMGLRLKHRDRFAIVAVLVLGLVLRLLWLDGQSLTMDEIEDLNVARRPADLFGLIKGARRFPPLYHLILRAWQSVFPGDLSARVLSVVLGLCTILVIYHLAKLLAGRRTAIWVAVLSSLSPFLIWYSQEVRVYGLVLLVAAASLLYFFRALESDSLRDWAFFVVAATAGIFSHYYFPVLLILTAAISAWTMRADRMRLKHALIAHGVLLLMAIPWAYLLLRDLREPWGASRFSSFGFSGFGYTYLSFVTGYAIGPSLRALHIMGTREVVVSMLPWLLVIALSVAVLVRSGYVALEGTRWRGALIVLSIAPVVIVGLASDVGPFGYNVRHVVWVFVPVVIWLGSGLSRWRVSRAVALAGLALIVVSGVALTNRHLKDSYRNEDSRAVAEFLESSGELVPVVVSAGYMASPLDYYLDDSWMLTPVPPVTGKLEQDRAILGVTRQLVEHGHVWFAYSREFHGDPEGLLLAALKEGFGVELVTRFAGYRLYRITASHSSHT